MFRFRFVLVFFILLTPAFMWGQGILQKRISDSLTVIARTYIYSDTINNVKINVNRPRKHITVTASDNFGYIPFRKENIDRINSALKSILHGTYPNYTIQAKAFNKNIEELIPDYLSEKPIRTKKFNTGEQLPPLVTKLSVPYALTTDWWTSTLPCGTVMVITTTIKINGPGNDRWCFLPWRFLNFLRASF